MHSFALVQKSCAALQPFNNVKLRSVPRELHTHAVSDKSLTCRLRAASFLHELSNHAAQLFSCIRRLHKLPAMRSAHTRNIVQTLLMQ